MPEPEVDIPVCRRISRGLGDLGWCRGLAEALAAGRCGVALALELDDGAAPLIQVGRPHVQGGRVNSTIVM